MALSLKWASLFVLTIHNSLTVFVMRISKTQPEKYISSTAVVCAEILKFLVSLSLHVYFRVKELGSFQRYTPRMLLDELFGKESDCLKTMVPALLYLVQNNLQYFSMTKLDPATFQISSQMKHIIIAIFSVLLLKRHLFRHQWISILLLAIGIALVQFPTGDRTTTQGENAFMDKALGLLSVFITCVTSGFAGVYFEKMLKKSKVTPWARNVQLSIFSVIPGYFIGCLLMDGQEIREKGFFGGYTVWTLLSILCQTFTGVIVAIVIKYADNILKGFANSISIILSCIVQYFLFDFNVTLLFTIGCAVVLYSSYLYGKPVNRGATDTMEELKNLENAETESEIQNQLLNNNERLDIDVLDSDDDMDDIILNKKY